MGWKHVSWKWKLQIKLFIEQKNQITASTFKIEIVVSGLSLRAGAGDLPWKFWVKLLSYLLWQKKYKLTVPQEMVPWLLFEHPCLLKKIAAVLCIIRYAGKLVGRVQSVWQINYDLCNASYSATFTMEKQGRVSHEIILVALLFYRWGDDLTVRLFLIASPQLEVCWILLILWIIWLQRLLLTW